MRALRSTLIVLCWIVPSSVTAQNWSPQQQEVLAHIQSCWEAWATNIATWAGVCRPSSSMNYWWANEGAPINREVMEKTIQTPPRVRWMDKRPYAIQIEGDVALVYFYALADFDDATTKERVLAQQKRLEIFRKVNDQWTFIGGMAVDVPTSD